MSDYEKTKRKLNPDGTIQYVVGGSRLTLQNDIRETPLSKMGVISYGDIASTMMPDIPIEISRHTMKESIEAGVVDKEQLKKDKLKLIYEDDIDDSVSYVYYANKRYPKNSKLFPGDLVTINMPKDKRRHNSLAQVAHVRNFSDWTISAIYMDGDYQGTKEIFTVDQYLIKRRLDGKINNNDYIKRVRTNILKEDDDNIDKI